jgi:hypothetical protein
VEAGEYTVTADSPSFRQVAKSVVVGAVQTAHIELQFAQLAAQHQSIVITADPVEPEIDLRVLVST